MALNEGWWGYEPMIISLVDGRVDFVPEVGPQRSVELAVIAWGADGRELFVRRRLVDGFRSYRVVVGRYDPDSRQLTPLVESRGRGVSAWPPSGGVAETIASLRQLPVVVRGEEELRSTLLLLDLDAGSTTELVKSECGLTRAAIAADGRTMAYRFYRTCSEDEDGDIWYEEPELHVIDLQGGRTREPISFSGRMSIYGLSPDGQRVLVATRPDDDARSRYEVTDADGTRHRLNLGRYVDGVRQSPTYAPQWLDNERLITRYDRRYFRSGRRVFMHVEVVDATTGDTLVRYAPD